MDEENRVNGEGVYGQPQGEGPVVPPVGPGYHQSYPAAYPHPYGNVAPPNEGNAVLALVLGIMSLVFCAATGPFAWYIGAQSRKRIQNSMGHLGGEGMATAGMVTGIIGTALLVVPIVFMVLWLFFGVGVLFLS